MKSLNFRGFGAKLRKCEERHQDGIILPQGLDEETFATLERVVAAKRPQDIEDIPTEEIARLFAFSVLYLGIFETEPLFNDGFYSRLNSKKGLLAKRRVL